MTCAPSSVTPVPELDSVVAEAQRTGRRRAGNRSLGGQPLAWRYLGGPPLRVERLAENYADKAGHEASLNGHDQFGCIRT